MAFDFSKPPEFDKDGFIIVPYGKPKRAVNLEMEAQFLQRKVIMAKGGSRITYDHQGRLINHEELLMDRMARTARFHRCCTLCRYENMSKDMIYTWQGTEYTASGDVYVCKETSLVHVCGVNRCFSRYIDPNGEGMMCSITGIFLAQELSLRKDWWEDDIRVVGNEIFNRGGDGEEIVKMQEKVEQLKTLGVFDEQIDQGHMSVTDYQVIQNMIDKNNHLYHQNKEKPKLEKKFFDSMLTACRNNENDVYRVLELFPREKFSDADLIEKGKERARLRDYAKKAWEALVVSTQYLVRAKVEFDKASDIWHTHVRHYIKGCVEEGRCYELHHIIYMWIKDVLPSLKSLHYGYDVEALKAKNERFMINAMLHIWDLYRHLDIIPRKNIQFVTCVSSILRRLATGLKVTIYLLGDDPKPYYFHSPTERVLKTAVSLEIEVIKPHSQLIIAHTQDIRKMHPTQYKSNVNSKGTAITSMVAGRKGAGCRNKTPMQRKVRQMSCLMPAEKQFNALVECAIEKSATLEEFIQKYCYPY